MTRKLSDSRGIGNAKDLIGQDFKGMSTSN